MEDASEQHWPNISCVNVKANAFEDTSRKYRCALCREPIEAVVCADSVGRDAHYGCAIGDIAREPERKHQKRRRQEEHRARWEVRRQHKRRNHDPPKQKPINVVAPCAGDGLGEPDTQRQSAYLGSQQCGVGSCLHAAFGAMAKAMCAAAERRCGGPEKPHHRRRSYIIGRSYIGRTSSSL